MAEKQNLTDRARRYRANTEDDRPPDPRVCNFCGVSENVEIDHIDGDESHGEPDNLMWLCRACNTTKGVVMRRAGLGRLTAQYNPAASAAGIDAWTSAADVLRGRAAGDVRHAVRTVRATPAGRRRQFAARLHQNPGIQTPDEFAEALDALDDGRPAVILLLLGGTPPTRWARLASQVERMNPGRPVPTYSQYAMGAAMHQRGAHDEGGAIIHATPRALRREYAARIHAKRRRSGGSRRRGGSEIPF
jgi:hypothetical protein